jgi:hypothetical protein
VCAASVERLFAKVVDVLKTERTYQPVAAGLTVLDGGRSSPKLAELPPSA